MDPSTGEFTASDPNDYSPTALVLLDFLWRLYGVRQEGTQLEWNCRLPGNSSEAAFSAATKTGTALLRQTRKEAILTLAGKNILSVKGTARIVTDAQGKPMRIVGTGGQDSEVEAFWPNGKKKRIRVLPNAALSI
jgi:hypothetical protein